MASHRQFVKVPQCVWEILYNRHEYDAEEERDGVRYWLEGQQRILAQTGKTEADITFYARRDYFDRCGRT